MDTLAFRVATASDRDAIFQMLHAAADWLAARGIDYWQNWHDPPPHHVAWIDAGTKSVDGETLVLYEKPTV